MRQRRLEGVQQEKAFRKLSLAGNKVFRIVIFRYIIVGFLLLGGGVFCETQLAIFLQTQANSILCNKSPLTQKI